MTTDRVEGGLVERLTGSWDKLREGQRKRSRERKEKKTDYFPDKEFATVNNNLRLIYLDLNKGDPHAEQSPGTRYRNDSKIYSQVERHLNSMYLKSKKSGFNSEKEKYRDWVAKFDEL